MRWLTHGLGRALVFAALWWVLSEGRLQYAGYGLVGVLLATAVSLVLLPPRTARDGAGRPGRTNRDPLRRAWAVAQLIGFYLARILIGGVDVARRAISRPLDIEPVVITVPVHLPHGAARSIALAMQNLMPGSLVQREHHRTAELHVLSADLDGAGEWAGLERRMAAVIGHPMPTPPHPA